ncbi:MAG: hemerythrin domain-containing protein [Gammaproteobacteria bacterium]
MAEPEFKRRSFLNDDIYDVLTRQHGEVKEMLESLSRSSAESAEDARKRQTMSRRLAAELVSHNRAESQTLYKRLLEFEDIRDQVEEHRREHDAVNTQLQGLLNVNVEDDAWPEKLLEIKNAVERHIEDEENRLFPEARKRLDHREAKEFVGKYTYLQDLRKNLMQPA